MSLSVIAETLVETYSSPSFKKSFQKAYVAPASNIVCSSSLFFTPKICKSCVNKSEWKSSPDPFTFGSFKSQSPNGLATWIVCEVKHPIQNQKEA
ncbi:hypothetical protein SESBI_33074 [Sesbania bispinosa]|nr:hypothetical protein SESBI_33074 [Sesbania bispinosa]